MVYFQYYLYIIVSHGIEIMLIIVQVEETLHD